MKIVITTCDKHAWVVPLFLQFQRKYWPDCPYKKVIVTDRRRIGRVAFHSWKKSWSSRLLDYLGKSKEDKILFTLEDYLIMKPVNTAKVKLAERLCEDDIGCVRLNNIPLKYFKKHRIGSVIDGFMEYPPYGRFSMVVQMAVFQKQFLIDVLQARENVWQTEGNGSVRLKRLKSKWRILWPVENVIDYPAGGLMRKGGLRPATMKWLRREEGIQSCEVDKMRNKS